MKKKLFIALLLCLSNQMYAQPAKLTIQNQTGCSIQLKMVAQDNTVGDACNDLVSNIIYLDPICQGGQVCYVSWFEIDDFSAATAHLCASSSTTSGWGGWGVQTYAVSSLDPHFSWTDVEFSLVCPSGGTYASGTYPGGLSETGGPYTSCQSNSGTWTSGGPNAVWISSGAYNADVNVVFY